MRREGCSLRLPIHHAEFDAERGHKTKETNHEQLHIEGIALAGSKVPAMNESYDFDYVVVGSGFGGSVSACRLTEKGYTVGVMEMGKRWKVEDLPKSNWDSGRYIWRPGLRMFGFYIMRFFRHVVVMCGNAVGGGSIPHANALLVPSQKVWDQGTWADLKDWKQIMPQHYATAERMLGVTDNKLLGDTYYTGRSGTFFPPPGEAGGSDGYEVHTESSTALFNKQRGSLPRISDDLGKRIRTNAESLIGERFPAGDKSLSSEGAGRHPDVLVDRYLVQHPHHRSLHGRLRNCRVARPRRDRRAEPRLWLPEHADLRRLHAQRQPGCEPQPDHHGADGTRHVPRSGESHP